MQLAGHDQQVLPPSTHQPRTEAEWEQTEAEWEHMAAMEEDLFAIKQGQDGLECPPPDVSLRYDVYDDAPSHKNQSAAPDQKKEGPVSKRQRQQSHRCASWSVTAGFVSQLREGDLFSAACNEGSLCVNHLQQAVLRLTWMMSVHPRLSPASKTAALIGDLVGQVGMSIRRWALPVSDGAALRAAVADRSSRAPDAIELCHAEFDISNGQCVSQIPIIIIIMILFMHASSCKMNRLRLSSARKQYLI
jgi:hypothetical protein